MNIINVNVYGHEQALKASGYPKSTNPLETEPSFYRAKLLASCKPGTEHDCFLKGIIVQFDILGPLYWWPQFQRYHFADIVSSQSKMHCLHKFKLEEMCNEWVDSRIIEIAKEHIEHYNNEKSKENFMKMISNIPTGFKLFARVVTNYLQLKTIYLQRKNHKLPEWETFCSWIRALPYSELIIGGN